MDIIRKENNEESTLNLSTNWVWVVIRVETVGESTNWHLQGIAADEELALHMCDDDTYIIGPVPLNSSLPRQKIDWVGAYHPHTVKK